MPGSFGTTSFGGTGDLDPDVILRIIEFCNNALAQAGQNFIDDMDAQTTEAKLCKQFYEQLLDATLREHFWNFATKRENLTAASVAPTFGWTYAYDVPQDWVRSKQLGDRVDCQPRWEMEGYTLVTNETTAPLIYIASIPDPALWDVMFYDAYSTHLASKIAMPMTKDVKFASGLYQLYLSKLPNATGVDGQETGVTQRQTVDDLIIGRND